jgi:serine/threonine-protein kinase
MALSFLVVGSAGIAAHSWGWEQRPLPSMGGVSWVGVWLVFFPAVVTLAPRQVLAGALLSWFVLAGITVASILVHGVPPGFQGSAVVAVVRMVTPVLICVAVAWAISYKIFALARDVSRTRRLGSYQLMEKIGSGGMGEVWKARHRLLARPAAVKLIRPESLDSDAKTRARALLRRFEREAQATALLTSPHSIMLYDFGIREDGVFYYVMELLGGIDLKTLVREFGPVPAERAVHFLRAMCDSLADAHDRGLIHRDIKPANVFICRRGRDFDFVKVLDFGLVKNVRESREALTQLTATGVAGGTPGFMAPEMVTGETQVDARADIYALGCVAYWLLTGRLVFEGNTPMAILVQHVKEAPPALSSRTEIMVPPALESLIHACLAKNPADRPASAEELGVALAQIGDELPAWTRERAERWWRTNLPGRYDEPHSESADTSASTVVGVQ